MNEFIASILAHLIVGLFWGLIATLISCFLLNKFVMPFRRNTALRKAWDSGHVVKATLKKLLHSKGEDTARWVLGVYEYTVNGREYIYKGRFYPDCPTEITLFYKINPRKAKRELHFGYIEDEWKIILAIFTLIFFVLSIIKRGSIL